LHGAFHGGKQIARESGGGLFEPSEYREECSLFGEGEGIGRTRCTTPLWNRRPLADIFAALFAIEWALRPKVALA